MKNSDFPQPQPISKTSQFSKPGAFSAQSAGAFSAQSAGAFSAQSAGAFSAQSAGAFSAQSAGAFSAQPAGAFSAQPAGAFSAQSDRGPISSSRVEKYGRLATPQSRLIAFFIDAAIFGFGLGIVWIIWFITLAEKGTTPGHYLMGQVIVDAQSGKVFGWKKMVVREVLIKGLMHWILGGFLFMVNYIIDASFIFTSRQRTLHDLMIGSHVIQFSDKTIIKKLKVEEINNWLNK